jgi:thiamine-phosphate diphosphorylase
MPRLYAIVDAGCFASAVDPAAAISRYARELLAAGVTLLQYRNKSGNAREMLSHARELRRIVAEFTAVMNREENPRPSQNQARTGHPGEENPRPSQNQARTGHPGEENPRPVSPKAGETRTGRPPESGETKTVPQVRAAMFGANLGSHPLGASIRLIMNDRADLCLAADFDGVHVGQDDLSPDSVRMIVGGERWVGVSTHNPAQVREADEWPVDYIAVGPVFATSSKANPDPVIGLEGVRLARSLTRKPLVAIGGITRANCREVIDAGADSVAVISDLLDGPRAAVSAFAGVCRAFGLTKQHGVP